MAQDFECPYCLDRLKDPVILKCGHNICRDCATKAIGYQTVLKPQVDTMGKAVQQIAYEDKDGGVRLFCPRCTKPTILKQGVQSLLSNNDLDGALKQLRQGLCQRCDDEPAKTAVQDCMDCQMSFCADCHKLVHGARIKHRTAELGSLDKLRRANQRLMCADHRSQEAVLFCNRDRVLVCTICQLAGAHKGHDCIPAEDASEALNNTINDSIESANALLPKLEKLIATVKDGFNKAIEENKAKRKVLDNKALTSEKLLDLIAKRKQDIANALNNRQNKLELDLALSLSGLETFISTAKFLIQSCQDEVKKPQLGTQQKLKLCNEMSRIPLDAARVRVMMPSRIVDKEKEKEDETEDKNDDDLTNLILTSCVPPVFKASPDLMLQPPVEGLMIGHIEQILKWFTTEDYKPARTKFVLLYRGSRDGYSAAKFHELCNNKGPTLSMIKSTTGYIFGGYAHTAWSSSGSYVTDAKAWLFSLTNPTNTPGKYNSLSDTYSVYHNPAMGPTFGGGHNICVGDNCNTSNESYTNSYASYVAPTKAHTYFTGARNFTVAEIEVFGLQPSPPPQQQASQGMPFSMGFQQQQQQLFQPTQETD